MLPGAPGLHRFLSPGVGLGFDEGFRGRVPTYWGKNIFFPNMLVLPQYVTACLGSPEELHAPTKRIIPSH